MSVQYRTLERDYMPVTNAVLPVDGPAKPSLKPRLMESRATVIVPFDDRHWPDSSFVSRSRAPGATPGTRFIAAAWTG